MQNTNRKVFENLISRTKIYLAIIFILLVILSIEDRRMIIPSILVFIAIMGYTYYANNKRKSEISETLQDLTLTVDSAAKTSLINSPFPLVILETDGNIIWKSSKFISEFSKIDINRYIDNIIDDIKKEIEKIKNKKDKTIIKQVEIEEKTYKIFGKYVSSKNKNKQEYMLMLYFLDDTENIRLQKEYNDSKSCVEIIMIDNYEETMQILESEEKLQITAK